MTKTTTEEAVGKLIDEWIGRDGSAWIDHSGDRRATDLHKRIVALVLAEREACAKIADGFKCGACGMDGKIAAAIRSRNEG